VRRFLILGSILLLFVTALGGADKKSTDTAKAAATRKKLKQKISVDWDDSSIKDIVDDLKEKVDGLKFHLDNAGGVSNNLKIKKYKADNKPVEDILADICKQKALGYIVISKKGTAYDGDIQIKQGMERGYPAGEEPDKMDAKDKDSEDDEKPAKGKDKGKDKTGKKDKAESKDKDKAKENSDDDPDKAEKDAERLLNFAKTLIEDGKIERAKTRLKDLVAKYPKTKAAESAQKLLKDLDK
jgi:hypothetical protein